MVTKLFPVLAVSLLAGCTLTKGEQYHSETLAAIQQSETNLSQKISNLELAVSNQTDYIDLLEERVVSLTEELNNFKVSAVDLHQTEEAEEEAKPVPVVIQSKLASEVVLGAVERVTIDSINRTFDARVDTGAVTSSLNAVDIELFERNGKNWVRFHLADPTNEKTDKNWIEAPVVRFVKIRQSTSENVERRAVVELWVKVGKIHEKAQFTLADRSLMTHPVLLGREFIRDIALVDVSRKYIITEKNKK
ncbi:ATP-dependent zinc protease family protein [Vibrio sp.]|uniref:ATP-dependent zinc protease family protein n=1 Tax=Vibrio sp. TaxID=678 RepID=UPI003D143BCD